MAVVRGEAISGELERAEEAAIRFLETAKVLRIAMQNNERKRKYAAIIGCPETATVKRASMDLTRALAQVRNL